MSSGRSQNLYYSLIGYCRRPHYYVVHGSAASPRPSASLRWKVVRCAASPRPFHTPTASLPSPPCSMPRPPPFRPHESSPASEISPRPRNSLRAPPQNLPYLPPREDLIHYRQVAVLPSAAPLLFHPIRLLTAGEQLVARSLPFGRPRPVLRSGRGPPSSRVQTLESSVLTGFSCLPITDGAVRAREGGAAQEPPRQVPVRGRGRGARDAGPACAAATGATSPPPGSRSCWG
jgi:hypothetical protein